MKMTLELSDHIGKSLQELKDNDRIALRSKSEIIRKALFIYSYISKNCIDYENRLVIMDKDKQSKIEDVTLLFYS